MKYITSKQLKETDDKMRDSLIRELIRFQDLLPNYIPYSLWCEWVESNEKVIDYLDYLKD